MSRDARSDDQQILIVEDDTAIAVGLALNLRIEGYAAAVAEDGEAALARIAADRPDLILLDINLPRKSGLEVLSELRDAGDQTPVIVLSARQDEYDKVAALRLGADDYVTKPFALAELLARVVAVLRRTRRAAGETAGGAGGAIDGELRFSDVVVDRRTRTVTRAGNPVRLTHLEFDLLLYLASHPSRVVAREELLREVWGLPRAGSLRTVDNFVAQLRSKIEDDADEPRHLITVRGSGYRFDP